VQDLKSALKEKDAKGERAKPTIAATPSIEEFHEQRKRKWKPTDDVDKEAKKPTTSITGARDPQLRSKPEVPTWKFFAQLRSTEMEADHDDDADDTSERQQH
jgi:hypothetical protein